MTLVLCCNKEYYVMGLTFLESVIKNWSGRVCILCIDFDPEHKIEKFEYATADVEDLPSYRQGWPANRDFFVCCEGGDFFKYFNFHPDELIIQSDVDMMLQRRMNPGERQMLDNFRQGDIGMSASSKPIMTIREEFARIKAKRNYMKVNRDFPGKWGFIPLYCTGVIIARADTYKAMSKEYLANLNKVMDNFDHHAAGQWLLNYIVHAPGFNVIDLGSTFHNASWFIDTDAVDDEYLMHDGQIVLFNHTKFLKEYNY